MEKKGQKDREKKEQEARKKFKVSRPHQKKKVCLCRPLKKKQKTTNDLTGWLTALLLCLRQLVGPLEAVHQVKVHQDCKGSKTELTLKQGECLDIIRVQGNPEGKWLARSQDGSSEWFS